MGGCSATAGSGVTHEIRRLMTASPRSWPRAFGAPAVVANATIENARILVFIGRPALLQELLARLLICHRPSEAENRLQFLPAAKLARFAAANTIVEARLGRLR